MESVSASAHRVMYGVPLFGCYRLGGGMLSKKAVKNDWCARKQNKKKFFFFFFFFVSSSRHHHQGKRLGAVGDDDVGNEEIINTGRAARALETKAEMNWWMVSVWKRHVHTYTAERERRADYSGRRTWRSSTALMRRDGTGLLHVCGFTFQPDGRSRREARSLLTQKRSLGSTSQRGNGISSKARPLSSCRPSPKLPVQRHPAVSCSPCCCCSCH